MEAQQVISEMRKRRETLAMTQEQLAELAGVGLRTLKALETGKSNPTLGTLTRLADVLGLEFELVLKKAK
jgi:DNA-binding XRE family transcriptional regulator